jgi:hypothetical protein
VTIGERGQCGVLLDLAAVQGLVSGAQCTAWWAQLGQLLPRVRQDPAFYSPTLLSAQEGRYVDPGCLGVGVVLWWCLAWFVTRP